MNQEELKDLIYFVSEKNISEFSIERADSTVRIKRHIDIRAEHAAQPSIVLAGSTNVNTEVMPGSDAPPVSAFIATPEELHSLKSPTVGIFQRGRTPDGPPFVAEGDAVEIGQVVGIIEVLRLMHEVHSDVAGEVVEITTGDREPVEYGQPLLLIRPERKPS
jgi:acetyl-CoA carboxylase biotin carboxyl carrier protein